MPTCPTCESDDLDLVEVLEDRRRHIRCNDCDHTWVRGDAKSARTKFDSYAAAKSRFPGVDQVDPARLDRVSQLKAECLRRHPQPQPEGAVLGSVPTGVQ